MRLTIAYSQMKKRNLVLINNDTYQRETVSERPIRQPLSLVDETSCKNLLSFHKEMMSAWFLWWVCYFEITTNRCNKFKLWKFWEHPLYEISEYAFN